MKQLLVKKTCLTLVSSLFILPLAGSLAFAETPKTTNSSTTRQTAEQNNQASRQANIKTKGDQEIARRITSLNQAAEKINSMPHLSATDKSYLSSQVSDEITSLNSLKSKLDADTTLTDAITDAKSIVSGYRVYALILPKVWLVRTADDQLAVEAKLSDMATKLQTRLDQASAAGKNVTPLSNTLADMKSQISAANSISSSIEQKVLNLQPTDYDSDHSVLSGDKSQLQTARQDNQKAVTDAKSIVSSLKQLEKS